jgi:hypothetical protein
MNQSNAFDQYLLNKFELLFVANKIIKRKEEEGDLINQSELVELLILTTQKKIDRLTGYYLDFINNHTEYYEYMKKLYCGYLKWFAQLGYLEISKKKQGKYFIHNYFTTEKGLRAV